MPDNYPNYRRWTSKDVIRWKLPEKLGGDPNWIFKYKDAWVSYNRDYIKFIAYQCQIPAYLLGGIAWVEVGGDPYEIDRIAFHVRSFDWSGPDFIDRNFTITKEPNKTSFGSVSMQLRVAAKYFGLNPQTITKEEQLGIIQFLESDRNNLYLVAKHILDLILVDYPNLKIHQLTDEHIRIIATRYNRGFHLTLSQIRANTSYGDVVVRIKDRITKILNGN